MRSPKGSVLFSSDSMFGKLTAVSSSDSPFQRLKNNIKNKSGTYGVYIKNLSSGQTYTLNADYKFYAASLFKLPVGVAVLKEIDNGNLSLEDHLTYNDNNYDDGSGIINTYPAGSELSVNDILKALYKTSDNSAQSMLLDKLDVNSPAVAGAFNLGSAAGSFYHEDIATVQDIGGYLEKIYVSNYLSDTSKKYLIGVMTGTSFDDRIANKLPSNLKFAHKIGTWPETNSWHDCGVVYGDKTFIVCLMSENTNFPEFLEVGKQVADFVNR